MIKVLDKSFAILEEIIAATPQPLGPLALAKKLGLNRTTCSRILRMLLDAGYIVQISRQAGYAAGPRIVTLNNRRGSTSPGCSRRRFPWWISWRRGSAIRF